MTAWRWVELTCDARDCGENFREVEPTGNAEHARRLAKAVGWTRVKGSVFYEDRCPEHSGASRTEDE